MRKTNFSYELQYAALSVNLQGKPDEVMSRLESALKSLMNSIDPDAVVEVQNSHKGNANKILEVVSAASDQQVEDVLRAFCAQNGVTITALE